MEARRRRIRWTRVFFLLLTLLLIITSLASVVIYAYNNMFHAATAVTASVGGREAPANHINILLLGLDDADAEDPSGPRRSDAMLVASINKDTGSVSLISIPRDTKVTIPGYKSYDKITHAYFYGGADLAKRTVEDLLRIPINYYVVVDWQAFIKVIDILGGVDLYVENDMDYEDPYANLYIHLTKGYQHLDGKASGEYVRFRHDELGDIGRVQRQQRFLKAMTDQALQIETILKMPSIINTVNKYVTTDMQFYTLLKLANSLKNFKKGDLQAEMVPGDFATIDGVSYWVYDKEQTKQVVDKLFFDCNSEPSESAKQSAKSLQ